MRIVCPSCSAAYEVPDRMVSAGKKVRCARCGENWLPEGAAAPPPPAAPEPAPPPSPPPPPPPPPPPVAAVVVPAPEPDPHPVAAPAAAIVPGARPPGSRARRDRLPVVAALAASGVVLVGLLGAALLWRGAIMAAWAPSRRLFGWLGLG